MKKFNLNIVIGAVDRFSKTFANVSTKVGRFGKNLQKMGKKLSIGVTAPLALFGRSAIRTQLELDAMENKMLAVFGTAEAGAKQIAYIRAEADRMGVSFIDAANGYALFNASALSAGLTLEQNQQIFKDINESAVALKLSKEQVRGAFKALEQMASKGTVQMEELRGQLGERIPGAVSLMAKAMGVTQKELERLGKRGEIISRDVLPKFAATVRKELGGSFEEASQSTQASLARYENSIIQLKSSISKSGLIETLTKITDKLKELADRFSELSPGMQKAIVYFAIFAAIIGPVLFTLGGIVAIAPAVAAAFAAISLSGLGIAVVAIALGVMIYQFSKLSDMAGGFGNSVKLLGALVLDMILSPLRLVTRQIYKIWAMFSSPPAFLTKFAFGSFGADAADSALEDKLSKKRALRRGGRTIATTSLNKTLKDQLSARLDVHFDNLPKGARTVITADKNAKVNMKQGIAMGGGF